jgi:DNA-binding NarL/FixJ family response regulator
MHAFLTASEKAAGPPAPPSSPPPSGAPAIVLGGSEDTRLLLRGLLRLHRHRVLFEAPTREGIDRIPVSPETKILVLDAGTDKGEAWAETLSSLLRSRSDVRALVILPSSDPGLETRARQAGARATLVRPFAIRDFIEAVDSLGTSPPPT